MPGTDPTETVRRFIEAVDSADSRAIAGFLAEDLVADITEPDASTREVHGRDAYMASIDAMNLPAVRPSIKATQIARVSDTQALAMIEIRANRKGRTLHNFTGQLMTVKDGLVTRIWMVEALPEESDIFWKA